MILVVLDRGRVGEDIAAARIVQGRGQRLREGAALEPAASADQCQHLERGAGCAVGVRGGSGERLIHQVERRLDLRELSAEGLYLGRKVDKTAIWSLRH